MKADNDPETRSPGLAGSRRRSRPPLVPAALLVSWTVSACGTDTEFETIHTIPLENASIVIDSAHSALAYGPSTVRVRRVDSRSDVVVYSAEIANDGGEITLDNIRPDLRSANDLRLCLNGAEQKDVYVQMDVEARSASWKSVPCTE